MPSKKYFLQDERNETNHCNYYYFKSGFTREEVVKLRETCEKYPKVKASTIGNTGSEGVSDYRESEISWIPDNTETTWIYHKIAEYSKIANKQMWNFDIWDYYDDLQYTTYYGNGGHYEWHMDLGPGISNRKLSCVIQLSDPGEYEGGELQINGGGIIYNVEKELGLVCFFPSFLLHRVTPVNSGVRKSLVTWLCGSNFR